MIFTETKLKGAFIIDIQRHEDPRGFFARGFCQREFEEHGLKPVIAQGNIAHNRKQGTDPRHAFPVSACTRNKTGALHARGDRGHHR